jgi:hypothetical protein
MTFAPIRFTVFHDPQAHTKWLQGYCKIEPPQGVEFDAIIRRLQTSPSGSDARRCWMRVDREGQKCVFTLQHLSKIQVALLGVWIALYRCCVRWVRLPEGWRSPYDLEGVNKAIDEQRGAKCLNCPGRAGLVQRLMQLQPIGDVLNPLI